VSTASSTPPARSGFPSRQFLFAEILAQAFHHGGPATNIAELFVITEMAGG